MTFQGVGGQPSSAKFIQYLPDMMEMAGHMDGVDNHIIQVSKLVEEMEDNIY